MNLIVIGTSHIAKQSINEIKRIISKEKPGLIALELDVQRASALLHEGRNKVSLAQVLQIGLKGYIFAKVGQYVQQKLGKKVGVAPGSEMKTALELARKNKIEVAFIDQPFQITLKNFSKALTWKEKWHFLKDMLKGLFFPRRQLKEMGLDKLDLTKVPGKEIVKKMTLQLKKGYPSIYKTLVTDRNKYMAKKLIKLIRADPKRKIIAVVGAGHVDGIKELMLKVDVVK